MATRGCETWTLSERSANSLLLFERQILGRLYGAVKTEEGCRIGSNEELDELMIGEDVVKCVRG